MVGKKKKDALITIVIIRVLLKMSEFCVVDYFSNISLFLMLKRGEKTLEANERVKILLPLQNDYLWNNCCSVTQSCPTLRHHGLKHTRLPYLSPSPRVCSNSCSLSPWFHPTILSYVVPFSSCFQSFPALVSFPMNQLFTSDGQSMLQYFSSISSSNEYSGLISFRIDWFDLLAVQGTLKSFL